ncbi:hypothetical protein [Actinomycetospora termitidis]|uniref:Uncharacterized protein n=1 Tax=Actinomycetospora termitidis TaxID=3053470 RepID=A0ABT7MHN7_9PSEU|nr:hypothetical protein [Actinomycetospora sp. Odt1-22]MDL5160192.1 hypothetical protein [Actinomycetospora sp. Odt1-22]
MPSLAQLERQAKAAQRDEEIAQLEAVERDLTSLHLDQFEPASRPVAPSPEPVDERSIRRRCEQEALRGVSVFARRERRAAHERAAAIAQQEIDHETLARASARDQAQRGLDAEWRALTAHEPSAVHAALEEAFEDNQSPATCVDVDRDHRRRFATVVLLFGDVEQVPEKEPGTTPTGRPTIRKRSKTARNELYVRAMSSSVLATVKEGFAVAPSVDEFRVVVVAHGHGRADAVFTGSFERTAIERLPWRELDPEQTVMAAPGSSMRRQGQARAVAALDLAEDPELFAIMTALAPALGCPPPGRPRASRSRGQDGRHRRPQD